jgi:hypothetical protein
MRVSGSPIDLFWVAGSVLVAQGFISGLMFILIDFQMHYGVVRAAKAMNYTVFVRRSNLYMVEKLSRYTVTGLPKQLEKFADGAHRPVL